MITADPATAFVGDSLTQGWAYPAANLGVYGNTTREILDRFPYEFPGHGYKRIVLLGGTNDILQRVDPAVTIVNLEAIADLAIVAGAKPVLCEVPPIFRGSNERERQINHDRVVDLNQRIVALAKRRNWIIVDYYDPLLSHPRVFSDGVHPRRLGYLSMEEVYLKSTAVR